MMVMLRTLRGQLSHAERVRLLLVPREAGDDYPLLRPFSCLQTSDTAEPRSATEEQQEPTSRPQERSWWRRMFGG